jgi:lipoyl(octanoyl) transferase
VTLISALQLGLIDYATGLRLQERLVQLRKEGSIGDVLLLLEHAPVITLGRNAKTRNILLSPEELAQRGVEVFECNRGGDVTFHGPEQLVAYPIFDLHGFASKKTKRQTMGAVEFVRRLEEVLIRTCGHFGVATERVAGFTSHAA